MVVELELLVGGEVTAYAEVGGVFDEGAVEGDVQGAVDQFARPQGTKASREKRPVRMAAHSGTPVASSR